MHFVTLTTDWHKNDFYLGAIKGSLLSSCEDLEIVSLSNNIKSYNIAEAAFIVRNSYMHFPKESIHIIAVNTQPEPDSKLLAAKINDHYFISSDNGFVGLLGDIESVEVVSLETKDFNGAFSFPALSVFSKAACNIISGMNFKEIGTPTDEFKKQIPLRATLENNTITGTIIYIDSYGNAFSNITKELFERIGKGRAFDIYVQSKHYKITELNTHYADTTPGDLLGMFNSINLLEIAIRNGSANRLLNLNTDSTVRVEFKDNK